MNGMRRGTAWVLRGLADGLLRTARLLLKVEAWIMREEASPCH
jgi:hypothetical protein